MTSDTIPSIVDGDAKHSALGNIIPSRRTDDAGSSHSSPILHLAEGDRPAPMRPHSEARFYFLILLLASLVLHAALYALSRSEPETMPSVGEDAITVEIIVGANSAAGTGEARNDVEADQQSVRDASPQQETVQEKPKENLLPREPPKDVSPRERQIEETPPEPKPSGPSRPKQAAPDVPAPAANSIGRGRMTAGDANYQGLVAARLARMKRYPTEARRRREQGSAIVSFVIDAAGRVTSVRLLRRTGSAALDEEVQAMVQRASPFPPPPRGAEMSFSAPVTFHLN
jgi:periplasmic protein TonB